MKYLAKVTLSPWAKAEKLCASVKDAHIWAFDHQCALQELIPVDSEDYLAEVAIMCKPQISFNMH